MEKEKINYKGDDILVEDLSEKAQYIVKQLKDLSTQVEGVKMRLDQLEVAYNSFTKILEEELEQASEVKTENEFIAE